MARRLVSLTQARRGFGFIDMQPDGSVQLNPDVGALSVGGSLAIEGPRPFLDLVAWGLDPTGTDDISTGILDALASAPSNGVRMKLPEGTYLLAPSSAAISLISNLILEGDGDATTIVLGSAYAGFIGTSTTGLVLRRLRIISSLSSSSVNGSFFAQGATRLSIEDCRFEGGSQQINLNNCSKFRVIRTSHGAPSIANGQPINLYQCTDGTVTNPQFDSYVQPVGTTQVGVVQVLNCDKVIVDSPVVDGIDMSTVPSGFIVGITNSTRCKVVTPSISNTYGADAILVQNSSSDISVVDPTCVSNGQTGGAGTNSQTGDGIDIFNSTRVRITNPILRNNGANGHHGMEINSSSDVTVIGGDSSYAGQAGVNVAGSQDVTIDSMTINHNQQNGILVQPFNSVDSTNVKIIAPDITDNNQAIGSTVGITEGIYWSGAATGQVIGGRITDDQATKTQTYGIRIENTASIVATGVSVVGNATGSILDDVGASNIRNCDGYNPVGPSTVVVGPSPWTYTQRSSPATLYLNGGTVSSIVKDTITLATATPAAIPLEPGQAVVVTYSVAPTAAVDVQ